MAQYAPAVLQTITNPDGTVSIIHMDPSQNPIITLPDGTTAQVQGLATLQQQGDGIQTVHAVQTLTEAQAESMTVDLNTVEGSINQEGQIILTSEDGHVSGVITVPVSSGMYQTMVANIQQLHTNSDGTVCVTPMVQVPKNCRIINVSRGNNEIEHTDGPTEACLDSDGNIVIRLQPSIKMEYESDHSIVS